MLVSPKHWDHEGGEFGDGKSSPIETHLECCISVAGFSDKCQNVTAYVSHIREVGWEGKMSSQGFVRIFVSNILKVFMKPFMKGAFSLTYILEATNFAGEAIDNVVAFAANFGFRRKFFAQFLAATKQLYEWYFLSVCLSVRLSVCHTFLTMFPSSYHH